MTHKAVPNPRFTIVLAFAAIFLVLFTAIGTSYVLSLIAVHRATANNVKLVQLCQTNNLARAGQKALWNSVLTTSIPPPGESPTQLQARKVRNERLERLANNTFAPHDCSKLKLTEGG